jgi:ABC-2 type transport system permease protein
MFIIIYGNMVMRSVIEEKTNRIIEIIISSVPFQLMIGKIIGTSLAGILQFFYMGFNRSFALCLRFGFGVNVPTARVSPELMEQAQQEFGTAQMYIKELWNYQ